MSDSRSELADKASAAGAQCSGRSRTGGRRKEDVNGGESREGKRRGER